VGIQLLKANALHARLAQVQGKARLEIVPCENGAWTLTVKIAETLYILACADAPKARTYPTMLGAVRRALHSFSDVASIWVEPGNRIAGCALTLEGVT
jgi:hypothetical protein